MFFTAGYKNTSIQLGTILSLTTPVLAVLNGHLLLGERLSLRFGLGAAMILAACVSMGIMERPASGQPRGEPPPPFGGDGGP